MAKIRLADATIDQIGRYICNTHRIGDFTK